MGELVVVGFGHALVSGEFAVGGHAGVGYSGLPELCGLADFIDIFVILVIYFFSEE